MLAGRWTRSTPSPRHLCRHREDFGDTPTDVLQAVGKVEPRAPASASPSRTASAIARVASLPADLAKHSAAQRKQYGTSLASRKQTLESSKVRRKQAMAVAVNARRVHALRCRFTWWGLMGLTWLPLCLLVASAWLVAVAVDGEVPVWAPALPLALAVCLWGTGCIVAYALFLARVGATPSHRETLLGWLVLRATACLCCLTRSCQDESLPMLPMCDSRHKGCCPPICLCRAVCCVLCERRQQLPPVQPLDTPEALESMWTDIPEEANIIGVCMREVLVERRLAFAHAGTLLCCVAVFAPAGILARLAVGDAFPWSVALIPVWLTVCLIPLAWPSGWCFRDAGQEGMAALGVVGCCGVLPCLIALVLLCVRLDGAGDSMPVHMVLMPFWVVQGILMLAVCGGAVANCVVNSNRRGCSLAIACAGSAAALGGCCFLAPFTATYILLSLAADGPLPGFPTSVAVAPLLGLVALLALVLCAGVCFLSFKRQRQWDEDGERHQQAERKASGAAVGITGRLLHPVEAADRVLPTERSVLVRWAAARPTMHAYSVQPRIPAPMQGASGVSYAAFLHDSVTEGVPFAGDPPV